MGKYYTMNPIDPSSSFNSYQHVTILVSFFSPSLPPSNEQTFFVFMLDFMFLMPFLSDDKTTLCSLWKRHNSSKSIFKMSDYIEIVNHSIR